MSTRKRIKNNFARLLAPPRLMLIGNSNGDVQVQTDNADEAGKVWVRTPEGTAEEQVFANGYSYQANLAVYVANDRLTGEPSIVGVDPIKSRELLGEAVGKAFMPPIPPGVWDQPIPAKALDPFRAQVSGFEVTVRPGAYRWQGNTEYFAGATVDLSATQSAITSGYQRMVVIYLDAATGALATTTTTERVETAKTDYLLADARAVSLTRQSQIPLKYVRLGASQTAIDLQKDVYSATAFATVGSDIIATPEATELTISSGAITVTQSLHTVDTESDAASDDLDTINGLVAGSVYILSPANAARTVVIKDGTGNIQTWDGTDITLDEVEKWVWLYAISSSTVYAMTVGGGGGGSTPPFDDDTALLQDVGDNTKKLRIDVANITTGNTRVIQVPDENGILVYASSTETLANKTLATPAIGDFSSATHNHTNAAGGGTLSAAAIASGTLAIARLPVNDASTASTVLWSASKINTELSGKVNDIGTPTDNRIIRANGTSGTSLQDSGVTLDDSDNMSGVSVFQCNEINVEDTTEAIATMLHPTTGDGAGYGADTVNGVLAFATYASNVRTLQWIVAPTDLYPLTNAAENFGRAGNRINIVYCVTLNESSDANLKTDIADAPGRKLFDFVSDVRIKRFRRKSKRRPFHGDIQQPDGTRRKVLTDESGKPLTDRNGDYIPYTDDLPDVNVESDDAEFGVVAQDIEQNQVTHNILERIVSTGEDGTKGVNYRSLFSALWVAFNYFVNQIYRDDRQQLIAALQNANQRINQLEARIDALENAS